MKCPKCGGKLKVIDCVPTPEEVMRRRRCLDCGRDLYTMEFEVQANQEYFNEWAANHRANAAARKKHTPL